MGFSAMRPKKMNQDSYILCPNFTQSTQRHLFAVNDGHGIGSLPYDIVINLQLVGKFGHLVANFVKEKLPASLESRGRIENNARGSLISAYQMTASALQESNIDVQLSGSTSVAVLFLRDKIYCSNVGDSRAILATLYKGAWTCHPLSNDHKPSCEAEAKRIKRRGGRVEPVRNEAGIFVGPHRVWLKDQDIPGLAMTRSLGDLIAASVGVTWMPEVLEHPLTPNDKFIVLGSDGLWEFLSNEEVTNLGLEGCSDDE
jgi:serine/threonine protein phosphatase PrpC